MAKAVYGVRWTDTICAKCKKNSGTMHCTATNYKLLIMIIRNNHIIMNQKEISDNLIHTAPRSVSLVHHNFRNDVSRVIPQS